MVWWPHCSLAVLAFVGQWVFPLCLFYWMVMHHNSRWYFLSLLLHRSLVLSVFLWFPLTTLFDFPTLYLSAQHWWVLEVGGQVCPEGTQWHAHPEPLLHPGGFLQADWLTTQQWTDGPRGETPVDCPVVSFCLVLGEESSRLSNGWVNGHLFASWRPLRTHIHRSWKQTMLPLCSLIEPCFRYQIDMVSIQ